MVFNNTSASIDNGGWFYLTDYGYGFQYPNFGDVYQTPVNYPIADQIGVGEDPKVAASAPYYVWGNRQNGAIWPRTLHTPAAGAISLYQSQTSNPNATFAETDLVQADRDFFWETPTFTGSSGIGIGTTAQMNTIVPAKAGVGFWVTDQGSWNTKLSANKSGELYTWNGSSWALAYTPFTYPYPPPGMPVKTGTAAFIGIDNITGGTWKGAYGADGYNVLMGGISTPAYAAVNITNATNFAWASSTSDPRALLVSATSSNRLAACDYTWTGNIAIDVDFTDGQTHALSIYLLNWDGAGRAETVNVFDVGTGGLLDSRPVSSFHNGVYLRWNISGHVQLQLVNNPSSVNVVFSGLFFDPPSGNVNPTPAPSPMPASNLHIKKH